MEKLAVVLGCSTGTGARICVELAKHGYIIIGFHRGRHQKEANEIQKEIMYLGRFSIFYSMDAGSTQENVIQCVETVRNHIKSNKIQVIVHGLAGASIGSMVDMASLHIEKTFNRLAHSFLWWIQEMVMRNRLVPQANIIALSNPVADFYLANSGVIGPAKAALESYVRCLAAELPDVNINALRFGAVQSPALTETLGEKAVNNLVNVHSKLMPTGNMLTADDVAKFVASFAVTNTRMTGAVLDFTAGSVNNLMNYALTQSIPITDA